MAAIASEIIKPAHSFAQAAVPAALGRNETLLAGWSILAASQRPAADSRPLFGFARQIALRGESALNGVPHLALASCSASRQEMESLRLVKRLMLGYRDAKARNPKPLSIGVFGAPGAGKSFASANWRRAFLVILA